MDTLEVKKFRWSFHLLIQHGLQTAKRRRKKEKVHYTQADHDELEVSTLNEGFESHDIGPPLPPCQPQGPDGFVHIS